MRTFVERSAPCPKLCQPDPRTIVSSRKRLHRLFVDQLLDAPCDTLALDQQPRRKLQTAAWLNPLKQSSQVIDDKVPVLKKQNVDLNTRRETEADRVSNKAL